jgi:hypothetical protein
MARGRKKPANQSRRKPNGASGRKMLTGGTCGGPGKPPCGGTKRRNGGRPTPKLSGGRNQNRPMQRPVKPGGGGDGRIPVCDCTRVGSGAYIGGQLVQNGQTTPWGGTYVANPSWGSGGYSPQMDLSPRAPEWTCNTYTNGECPENSNDCPQGTLCTGRTKSNWGMNTNIAMGKGGPTRKKSRLSNKRGGRTKPKPRRMANGGPPRSKSNQQPPPYGRVGQTPGSKPCPLGSHIDALGRCRSIGS